MCTIDIGGSVIFKQWVHSFQTFSEISVFFKGICQLRPSLRHYFDNNMKSSDDKNARYTVDMGQYG